MANDNLRPGKGAHLDLTMATLEFVHQCIEDLWNAAGDPEEADNLDTLVDSGEGMQYLRDIRNSATHWVATKDDFGTKLYKKLDWQDGEIRVTVVLNKQGALKLDVRYWYDPDGENTPKKWDKG
jgi:hypothetical protein